VNAAKAEKIFKIVYG